MSALFRKPDNESRDGYDQLESGYFWRLRVPVGEWRTVALNDANTVSNVLTSNDVVTNRKPPVSRKSTWLELYEIFGKAEGSSMLTAYGKPPEGGREENAPQLTYIQIQVVKAGSAAPTGQVVLDFRTTSFSRRLGDYDWQVEFLLKNAGATSNGFIVQKVTFRSNTTTCDGSLTNDSAVWWEAWQVRNGKIFSGTSATVLSLGDQFTSSNTTGTKGQISTTGETKYMPDYAEPLKWGKFKMAGSLPATTNQPPGWSSDGALSRWIAVEYDSCQNPPSEGPMKKHPSK